MTDTLWYQKMATAMAKREKALNAVMRWQKAVADAEAEIEALRAGASSELPPSSVVAEPQLATE
jgi:hypothetical protein